MADGRILHSLSGYLRYMQMSKATIFVFVEGKESDPYFYGQICNVICNQRNIIYKICKANEIPPRAGGKTALLQFYDYLLKRKALSTVIKGKMTIAFFFLDKDIDDITNKCRRSRYIAYTNYYDVQNEIFLNGDLVKGCAAAASLDPVILNTLLADSHKWCRQAAENWREWVVLCVISILKNIDEECNYRVHSKIQNVNTGKVDAVELSKMKKRIANKSGMRPSDFEEYYNNIRKKVCKIYSSGQQDKIFRPSGFSVGTHYMLWLTLYMAHAAAWRG